jgi:hypothetical protein
VSDSIDEKSSVSEKSNDIIKREKSFKVKDFGYFYSNSFQINDPDLFGDVPIFKNILR